MNQTVIQITLVLFYIIDIWLNNDGVLMEFYIWNPGYDANLPISIFWNTYGP